MFPFFPFGGLGKSIKDSPDSTQKTGKITEQFGKKGAGFTGSGSRGLISESYEHQQHEVQETDIDAPQITTTNMPIKKTEEYKQKHKTYSPVIQIKSPGAQAEPESTQTQQGGAITPRIMPVQRIPVSQEQSQEGGSGGIGAMEVGLVLGAVLIGGGIYYLTKTDTGPKDIAEKHPTAKAVKKATGGS